LWVARPYARGVLRAGAGVGLDDRTRFLVGGENPYVIPMAGAGWAELLVDRFLFAEAEAGVGVGGHGTIAVGVDTAVVNDPLRDGSLESQGALGGGYAAMRVRLTDATTLVLRVAQGLLLPGPPRGPKAFLLVEWRAWPRGSAMPSRPTAG
jgi:hypothetical protein